MKNKLRALLLFICDIVLINISFSIAYLLHFDWDFNSIPIHMKASILNLFIASCIIKLIVFKLFKLYNSLWRYECC